MMLCATFDFQWPPIVKQFFESVAPIAASSESILSIDCFIDGRDKVNYDNKQINSN